MDPSAYRPISNIPVMGKLFKKLLYNYIISRVEPKLSNNQHGVRKFRSCMTANAVFSSFVFKSIDKRNSNCGALFIDLKRAFDFVDPFLLLKAMHEKYNLNSNLLALLANFCLSRNFQIRIGNFTSANYVFNSACLQGSTLAPLLFMLFFDQISECISLGYLLFADDLVIFTSSTSSTDIVCNLNSALTDFNAWCLKNNLVINFSKTKWMLFSKTSCHTDDACQVSYENVAIEKVANFKYLGVFLDERRSFIDHFEHVFNKLCSATTWILKIKRFLNSSLFRSLLHAFIFSHIDYCFPIWGSLQDKYLCKLENKINHLLLAYFEPSLLRKYGKNWKAHWDPNFTLNKIGVLNVRERYRFQVLDFTLKF